MKKDRRLRNKVGGVIVVAYRAGATEAFSAFLSFLTIQRMILAGGSIAYAGKMGEVSQDIRGMAEAKARGKAVVRTIQGYKGKLNP